MTMQVLAAIWLVKMSASSMRQMFLNEDKFKFNNTFVLISLEGERSSAFSFFPFEKFQGNA
jgi:hypothetical protein